MSSGSVPGIVAYAGTMALRVFLIVWGLVILAHMLWSTVGRWNKKRGRGL